MIKVMAVLRSLFLLFVAVLALRAWPFLTQLPRSSADGYDRCFLGLERMQNVVLYAIGWILLEVAIGWWRVVRRSKADRAAKNAALPAVKA